MDPGVFYLIFIPGFTILAFLTGSLVAWIAMSDRSEPVEEPGEGQPAH